MHRFRAIAVLTGLIGGVLVCGCGKDARPQIDAPAERQADPGRTAGTLVAAQTAGQPWSALSVPAPELSQQEKYDAALLEALNLTIDRKYSQALIALERARACQDTEQVRQQIQRVKTLIDQQVAADRMVQDIQTVLEGGKPEEAARLATAGLQQFGGSDDADRLAKLKIQAEALATAQLAQSAQADDRAAHRARLRQEAEAAMGEKNLRAAAIAYEQALQLGDDADVRRRLDDIQGSLTRYDDRRRRAAELRRDPVNLEDAIVTLQQAAQAWDTLQVHQEIDDCTLALQKRRDRLSVADFEIRGELGVPSAGRTVADELLPAFKARFDLVERGQLGKVVDELRVEASELSANAATRQEVGRLARVRYLVVGSVTVADGIIVNARLVDVRSGLIVQTARLAAPTPSDLIAQLPQLANLLMMTDEQKMAFEQQQAQRTVAAPPVVVVAPLPPPPVIVVSQPLPPPVIVFTTQPPDFGGLRPQDFDRLPPPAASVEVVVQRDDPYKQRTVQVAVELGDNLFRRGKYREAHAQFELALSLSPHHKELSLRIESCRPYLPPPPVVQPVPVVVAAPAPVVVVARPRIAVLNFVVNADPGLVPPAFGDWASEQVASYFTPTYDVVERGEVCWYMGRLGVTMRDVLMNPSARVCLGRALNVRFFVFGAIQQTASFDISTHLIDAESGAKQGGGQIHVQDHQELKLRAAELVQQVQTNPAEANRLRQEALEKEKILNEARSRFQAGQYAQTVSICQEGLKRFPDHAGLRTLEQQAEQKVQQAALEQKRKEELAAQQARVAAAQKQQQDAAREAEAARKRAEAAAATRTAAERQAQEAQRQKAYEDLYTGAHRALQQGNYPQAVQLLQSAVALKPTDVASRELAQARAQADQVARARAAQEQAGREAEAKRQKEAELARARAQVEEARRKQEADELARRQAKAAEDAAKAAAAKKTAEDAAKAAAAKKAADDVERAARSAAATKAAEDAAKAAAAKKTADDAAKAAAAKKAADDAEHAARSAAAAKAAEDAAKAAAAKKAVDDAAKAAATKKAADDAEHAARATAAAKAAEDAARASAAKKAAEDAAKVAAAKKAADDAGRAAQVSQLLTAGRNALNARQLDVAAKAFADAGKLAPGDPAVTKGIQDVEQARRAAAAAAEAEQKRRMEADARNRAAAYQAAMNTGKQALAAKRYDDAVRLFTDASRAQPGDAAAAAMLKEVDRLRRAEYARLMPLGKAAMTAKKYDEAVNTYAAALAALPGDPAAAAALKDAQQALQASKSPPKR
jgi:tetratricopeptide (TPR) repeat protein